MERVAVPSRAHRRPRSATAEWRMQLPPADVAPRQQQEQQRHALPRRRSRARAQSIGRVGRTAAIRGAVASPPLSSSLQLGDGVVSATAAATAAASTSMPGAAVSAAVGAALPPTAKLRHRSSARYGAAAYGGSADTSGVRASGTANLSSILLHDSLLDDDDELDDDELGGGVLPMLASADGGGTEATAACVATSVSGVRGADGVLTVRLADVDLGGVRFAGLHGVGERVRDSVGLLNASVDMLRARLPALAGIAGVSASTSMPAPALLDTRAPPHQPRQRGRRDTAALIHASEAFLGSLGSIFGDNVVASAAAAAAGTSSLPALDDSGFGHSAAAAAAAAAVETAAAGRYVARLLALNGRIDALTHDVDRVFDDANRAQSAAGAASAGAVDGGNDGTGRTASAAGSTYTRQQAALRQLDELVDALEQCCTSYTHATTADSAADGATATATAAPPQPVLLPSSVRHGATGVRLGALLHRCGGACAHRFDVWLKHASDNLARLFAAGEVRGYLASTVLSSAAASQGMRLGPARGRRRDGQLMRHAVHTVAAARRVDALCALDARFGSTVAVATAAAAAAAAVAAAAAAAASSSSSAAPAASTFAGTGAPVVTRLMAAFGRHAEVHVVRESERLYKAYRAQLAERPGDGVRALTAYVDGAERLVQDVVLLFLLLFGGDCGGGDDMYSAEQYLRHMLPVPHAATPMAPLVNIEQPPGTPPPSPTLTRAASAAPSGSGGGSSANVFDDEFYASLQQYQGGGATTTAAAAASPARTRTCAATAERASAWRLDPACTRALRALAATTLATMERYTCRAAVAFERAYMGAPHVTRRRNPKRRQVLRDFFSCATLFERVLGGKYGVYMLHYIDFTTGGGDGSGGDDGGGGDGSVARDGRRCVEALLRRESSAALVKSMVALLEFSVVEFDEYLELFICRQQDRGQPARVRQCECCVCAFALVAHVYEHNPHMGGARSTADDAAVARMVELARKFFGRDGFALFAAGTANTFAPSAAQLAAADNIVHALRGVLVDAYLPPLDALLAPVREAHRLARAPAVAAVDTSSDSSLLAGGGGAPASGNVSAIAAADSPIGASRLPAPASTSVSAVSAVRARRDARKARRQRGQRQQLQQSGTSSGNVSYESVL